MPEAWSSPATDPHEVPAAERRRLVGLVPQTPADLLYLETVGEECQTADREAGAIPGSTRALLDRLAPGVRTRVPIPATCPRASDSRSCWRSY